MAGELEQIEELDERIEPTTGDEGRRLWQGIVALVVLMVLVGALLAAVPGLRAVADRLSDVNPWWIVLAIVLELGSCAGYVFAFQHVFYRAPPLFAARVALSEMAFSAVLPAGGAVGIAVLAFFAALPALAGRVPGTGRPARWARVTGRVVEASMHELRHPTWRLWG